MVKIVTAVEGSHSPFNDCPTEREVYLDYTRDGWTLDAVRSSTPDPAGYTFVTMYFSKQDSNEQGI